MDSEEEPEPRDQSPTRANRRLTTDVKDELAQALLR